MSFLKKQSLLSGAILSVILIWCLLFLLIALVSVMCGHELLPMNGMNIFIILCEVISIFSVAASISGVYAKKYLYFCMICAGIYSLTVALVSICLDITSFSVKWIFENTVYCVLSGLLAAFVHIPQKKRKRR